MTQLALWPFPPPWEPSRHHWQHGPGDASECMACGEIWYPWAGRATVRRLLAGPCPGPPECVICGHGHREDYAAAMGAEFGWPHWCGWCELIIHELCEPPG
jgi:hypothetical protein